LKSEIDNLVHSLAAGVPAKTVAEPIQTREADLARIEAQLHAPKPPVPNLDALRVALTERTAAWTRDLRREPAVSRILLRRLVTPLTLWNAAEPGAEWIQWEADLTPGLLDGLTPGLLYMKGTSPTGLALELGLPEALDAVRDLRSFVGLVRELRDREREGL
jgi:hypothetical protein